MLKQDLPSSLTQNHFNFLQMVHGADPLAADQSGIQHVYSGHINGYAGYFTDGVVEQLRSMPEVDYVERDQVVHTMELQKFAPWVGVLLSRFAFPPRLYLR
jgi:cerevisin